MPSYVLRLAALEVRYCVTFSSKSSASRRSTPRRANDAPGRLDPRQRVEQGSEDVIRVVDVTRGFLGPHALADRLDLPAHVPRPDGGGRFEERDPLHGVGHVTVKRREVSISVLAGREYLIRPEAHARRLLFLVGEGAGDAAEADGHPDQVLDDRLAQVRPEVRHDEDRAEPGERLRRRVAGLHTGAEVKLGEGPGGFREQRRQRLPVELVRLVSRGRVGSRLGLRRVPLDQDDGRVLRHSLRQGRPRVVGVL
jgi:hypothetical protein